MPSGPADYMEKTLRRVKIDCHQLGVTGVQFASIGGTLAFLTPGCALRNCSGYWGGLVGTEGTWTELKMDLRCGVRWLGSEFQVVPAVNWRWIYADSARH